MEKRNLDYGLVPAGLLVMILYHLWVLYRIKCQPHSTVIGLNCINRRLWVAAMMEDSSKNGVLAVQTLRNNIMASTLLASTAIMLSSAIAVLMSSANNNRTSSAFVFGDTSQLGYSIKYFAILVCFLAAFLFNVQSIRYYSHASVLINAPFKKMSQNSKHHNLTTEYVADTVNRGSHFWSLGLRAYYFSFPLFLWIFGPIPMIICCFLLVGMLYYLDVTSQIGWVAGVDDDEQNIVIAAREEEQRV